MKFRPCIDLHQGVVKQIVGSTLSEEDNSLETNFEADKPAGWFAECYKNDELTGGHVIQLGGGNESAAKEALSVWPGHLQIGGGITIDNAGFWIDNGAEAVIVTSWVFHDGVINKDRLKRLSDYVGKEKLVLDLSCRMKDDEYLVVTNRWQTYTEEVVSVRLMDELSKYCCEFLVHAVDVEGMCHGIEVSLVELLGQWAGLPVTYAGGIRSMADIDIIKQLGKGNIDYTVGSALDIFGGNHLKYDELVKLNAIK